ncbi:hypothetical protein MKD33_10245, partial [Chromobacterium piscinae]
ACCLIPEATALFQERSKEFLDGRREAKFFYVARCYRYERPQAGRYREFTQLGCEYLSADPAAGQPREQAALPGLSGQPGAALSARQRGSARTQLLPERRGIRNAGARAGRAKTGVGGGAYAKAPASA